MIEEMGGDFLQWLRGFYYVAKRGSMTLAALEMGRNQPTISHQIKCLENEFGVTFFDRSGGKMTLTPEGKVFLEKAISLFEIIKEMKNEVSAKKLLQQGEIVIVTTHAISCYYLPRFIIEFNKEYTGVRIKIEGGGLKTILERLESAEADFGIASFEDVPDTLDYYEVFQTRLRLIAPKNNTFIKKKRPSLKQIAEAPFILFPRTTTITSMIEKQFSYNDLKLKSAMTLNNYEDVKNFVELGVGVSILDEYTITEEDKERFDIFPVERFFGERKYGLIVRKKKYLSPPVKVLIRSIKPDIQLI